MLVRPITLSRNNIRISQTNLPAPSDFYSGFFQFRHQNRQVLSCDRFVNKNCFNCITSTWVLSFGINNNRNRFLPISHFININMTNPIRMTQNSNFSICFDVFDQSVTASWNNQIDILIHFQHSGNVFTVKNLIDGIGRKFINLSQSLNYQLKNSDIGIYRLFAAF